MSITIDDKTANIFMIFDELTQTYSKEIDGYKALTKAVEAMIDQKERELQGIKDKTLALLKGSIPYPKIAVPQEAPLIIETEILHIKKTRPQKKQIKTRKSIVRPKDPATGKTEPDPKAPRSKITEKPARDQKHLNCLYHPESPAVDMQRQLCTSCRWKLRSNGLTGNDKDPKVISFLKGETSIVPDMGQPMCLIHPEIPAYSKKTGLCLNCQRKARSIGVTDRPLTEAELVMVR
jgi:hypothetical protein